MLKHSEAGNHSNENNIDDAFESIYVTVMLNIQKSLPQVKVGLWVHS